MFSQNEANNHSTIICTYVRRVIFINPDHSRPIAIFHISATPAGRQHSLYDSQDKNSPIGECLSKIRTLSSDAISMIISTHKDRHTLSLKSRASTRRGSWGNNIFWQLQSGRISYIPSQSTFSFPPLALEAILLWALDEVANMYPWYGQISCSVYNNRALLLEIYRGNSCLYALACCISRRSFRFCSRQGE